MPLLILSAILFGCALIQVVSGFGFALLAMPLIALVLNVEQAAPVVALAALVLNTANAIRLHRHINAPQLLRLWLAGLAGAGTVLLIISTRTGRPVPVTALRG